MEEEKPVLASKVSVFYGKILPTCWIVLGVGMAFRYFAIPGTEGYLPAAFILMGIISFLLNRWYSLVIYKERLIVKYPFGTTSTVCLDDIVAWKESGWFNNRRLHLYCNKDKDNLTIRKVMFNNYDDIKTLLTENKPQKSGLWN